MDVTAIRQAIGLAIGFTVGLALVALATGDLPDSSFLFGLLLAPLVVLALSRIDGPLNERAGKVGAIVVSAVLVGAALLLV
ncbi:hypothetical protein [Natronolimnohabitans innermongolicus]|uniref:Uncharacterized protein n=1 Tax=Natronolimnohabitans innermongolicus JCM 12255 TaxID=1227499 RepID=L9XIS1_9EURY|nr:hypothetical protein [Natronolimnohabitans innermongolicus]ELY61610.1 hypothetical protein C493_02061 [Natronolimnohabitans innermongolicus JCM 12255]